MTFWRSRARLRANGEIELVRRYALRLPPRERVGLYRRMRMAVGSLLRTLGLRRRPQPEPWLAGLKHLERSDEAQVFLIWALGIERDSLRAACKVLEERIAALPDWVPVLVTDVADFAFYSRLGWLVEYLPELSPPAGAYRERKRSYLVWRYRGAPVVPISVGLESSADLRELLVGRS